MYNMEIKNLSFAYDGDDRLILKDISMQIEEGEFVCLLGQSGCGKSTFLRLLAGLEKPTTGVILLEDEQVKKAGLDRGVVFQDYGLFPWMSAGENILLALTQRFPKQSKKELKQKVIEALEAVGLDESVYHKLPKELSGGMKQRCAIARALGVDSPVLLMDEPFGALDAVTRAKLQDLVLGLWAKDEKKKTVFFVTHDVDEALLLGNRICVFGQSPSSVIYEYKIADEARPTRSSLYENPETLALRNQLIKYINQDIAERC